MGLHLDLRLRKEWWASLILLLLFARAVLPVFFTDILVGLNGQVFHQVSPALNKINYLSYAVGAVIVLFYLRELISDLMASPLLFLFLVYITFALFASGDIVVSLLSTLEYGFSSLMRLYLARRFNYREYMSLIGVFFMIIFSASLLFLLIFPSFSYHIVSGESFWRGVFINKNTLGLFSMLGTTFFLMAPRHPAFNYKWIMVAVGILLVIRSAAVTSILALMIIITVYLIARIRSEQNIVFSAIATLLVAASVIGLTLIYFNFEGFLGLFGKEETFSGRTLTIENAWITIKQNPLFGTGGTPILDPEQVELFGGNMAHSGHVNFVLYYGLAGALIYLAIFFSALRRSLRFLHVSSNPNHYWPFAYLLFWIVVNITERPSEGIFFWVIFIAHYSGTKLWAQQHRA